MARFVLTAEEAADRRTMGGKASALAALHQAELPIPAWFVVRPEAFSASLTAEHLAVLEHASDGESLRRIIEQVQPAPVVVREILDQLRTLCPTGQHVAVRSSCIDEDSADHSFAGQYDSFLFVPHELVIARVVAVWRSGFSPRVLAYRQAQGLPPLGATPAVLIQQMIDAEAAGAAFSADPVSGRRTVAVVSAVFGLGSSLVGGEADADVFRIDRSGKIIERQIAHKNITHRCDAMAADGFRAQTVPPDRADAPALSDAQAIEVAVLARRVSCHFGRPQDIEWAFADGTLYLLQSRPITSLSTLPDPDGMARLWDNSNIAESYSGITTPLTYSFARRAYEGVYRQFCLLLGVQRDVVDEHDDMFRQMLGLIRGRVYYNLLNWYRLLTLLPGFTANRGFMEQMMGVREGLPDAVAAELSAATRGRWIRDQLGFGRSVIGLIGNHFALPRAIRRFYARLDEALAPPHPALAEMRIDELAASYRQLERKLVSRWDAPLVNDFFAMIFFGLLRKLTAKWCGDKGGNLHNDLICGEGGIISTEPARRIADMGRLAANDVQLTEVLCTGNVSQATAAITAHEGLRGIYQAYLDKFGDRCLQELKLESTTLEDDPLPLLRSIGHAARRVQAGHVFPAAGNQDARVKAQQQVRRALRFHPLRRMVFARVLRHARGRVRDRENLRFERTRLFGRVRRIFVELGRRLMAEGLLDTPRDVFYLELEEILGFVEGTATCTDLRALAAARKAEFDRYRDMNAPDSRCETHGAVHLGNRFKAAQGISTPPAHAALRGIGCCPGVVRGPVMAISRHFSERSTRTSGAISLSRRLPQMTRPFKSRTATPCPIVSRITAACSATAARSRGRKSLTWEITNWKCPCRSWERA